MGNPNVVHFAKTNFRSSERTFGIRRDDRRQHMYIIGKTGTGKTNLLKNMAFQDINNGDGIAIVDPHGSFVEEVLEKIPDHRLDDVIYFNPADSEFPIGFNVLEVPDPRYKHLVASDLMGIFTKIWANVWSSRMEYILNNCVLALLDTPGTTLLGIQRILVDKDYRRKIIDNLKDPLVRSFWVQEYESWQERFRNEAIAPIQNKVGQFLSTSFVRNIVGQPKSAFNIQEVMNQKKILLMNVAKWRIGEDNAQLLGAMLITKIQLAAMERVRIPEEERKDFYLYVDEFQNFATDSFANILSEARKYRLNLIMAHQYIEQLGEKVKPAVFGNVGTLIVFRVGAADAEELVKEFTPVFLEEDIVNLPKYEFYLKLMIDGIASDPFSARGLPPLTEEEKTGNDEKVINVSRERYARGRGEVEEKITRWHESIDEDRTQETAKKKDFKEVKREAPQQSRSPQSYFQPVCAQSPPFRKEPDRRERETGRGERDIKNDNYNSATCSRCGKETKISFVPYGIRPIFCKDCLSTAKNEKKKDAELRMRAKEQELQKIEKKVYNQEPANPFEGRHENNGHKSEELSLSDLPRKKIVDFKGRE